MFFPRRYIYVLVIYVGIALILGGIAIPLLLFNLFDMDIYQANIYGNLISFTISLVLMLRLMRPDFEEEKLTSKTSVGTIIAWSFLGVILAFVAQITAGLIETNVFKIEMGSDNTKLITKMVNATPLFFLIPAIIGPILEELVFRKIIFGSLYKSIKHFIRVYFLGRPKQSVDAIDQSQVSSDRSYKIISFILAGAISALIFAAAHQDFEHILIYAAMGFTFAFLYVMTNRIIVPIITHMAMNSIVLMLQQLVDIEELEKQLEQLEEIRNGIIMIFFGG